MPCITFILPIYNMERLLPRALRSLRAQTLTDFEAILINDCLLYTSPSPRDGLLSRMPSSA